MVQVPGSGETRFGAIRFKVGARSVGRGKRVPCGGSHGHGMEVSVRTLATDRKLCFLPKPMGAGLDPSRDVRREGPVPRSGRPQDASFYSVYLDGFSHAELKHWNQLSNPEKWSWEAEAVHEAWHRWCGPSQTEKAIINELELEPLGCRIDGNAGVIAPPRSVVSRLVGLTAWFARNRTQRPATPHGRNSWRPLGPLLGVAPFAGDRFTWKGHHSPKRGARRSPSSLVPSTADAFLIFD